jgi:hypothetical protein
LLHHLPEKGYSGLGDLGCCIDDGLNCIGCGLQEDGLDCAITQDNCPIGGTNFEVGQVCLTVPGGEDRCDPDTSSFGCCVLEGGSCEDGRVFGLCNSNAAWFQGVQCSEVPECPQFVPPINNITSPIPTLSQWGLIAMAGVLGIVGFIVMRRRKVSA